MDLQSFFHPSSIAIVGVSTNPLKVGHLVAKNMLDQGYSDELYFIHPEAKELLGKKVYSSLTEIGKPVELVILAVPSHVALNYLDEVRKVNCRNVVMYAAGFKENGGQGIELEEQLVRKAQQLGITLLGPNCLGFINTEKKINATFLKGTSPKGNIGFISQSGALGSVLVDYFAGHKNLGFSYFVSLGNKAVLDESDTLAYLRDDESTKVIGMYLEDIKNGKKFIQILEQTSKKKPVIILKSGSTAEGSKAALSHTGGMVGSDEVYDAAFRQCGAIRANSYSEFLNLLRLCSFGRLPSSRHTLVLSNAGGVGVLLADDLVKHNLSLVTVSEKNKEELNAAFADSKKITVHNPIDLLGDASAFDYQKAITSTLDEKNIGSVIVLLTPQANTEIIQTAKVVAEAQKHFDRPIFPVFMGKKSLEKTHDYFENNLIPYFKTYDGLPTVLHKLNEYHEWKKINTTHESNFLHSVSLISHKQDIQAIINLHMGKPFLDVFYSLEVLRKAGIPTSEYIKVHSVEELHHTHLQFPVAAKLLSDTVTHKTEVAGVATHIKSLSELELVCRQIMRVQGSNGCLIQPMVKGHELFLGAKRDPTFGVVIVLGIGGIYTELVKEVKNFIYPVKRSEFDRSLERTKIKILLDGFRGSKPVDLEVLYETIEKLGLLMQHIPHIREIDINPFFVTSTGGLAADARLIL